MDEYVYPVPIMHLSGTGLRKSPSRDWWDSTSSEEEEEEDQSISNANDASSTRGNRRGRNQRQGQGNCGRGQGDRGRGQGDRSRGHSDRGRGRGDRGRGRGDRGRGRGDRGRGKGDRGRGQGDRGRGQGDRGRGQGDRSRGQGDRGRGQGDRGRGQGDRGRGQGNRGRGQGRGNGMQRWQSCESVGASAEAPEGQTRVETYHQWPMGYRKLSELASNDCNEDVTLELTSSKSGFELLIKSDTIKRDWVLLILQVLEKACKSTHRESVLQLLTLICSSDFIGKHILAFLTDSLISGGRDDLCDIIKRVLFLFENIEHKLPSSAEKCVGILIIIKTVCDTHNLLLMDPAIEQKRAELLELCQKSALVEKEKTKEKQHNRRRRDNVLNADEDAPPEDFREIEIFPDAKDLHHHLDVFLRKNKHQGGYANLDTYLDVQFRLLREDYIQPLRQGIQEYRSNQMKGQGSKQLSDLRLYKGIHILGSVCGEDVETRLRFDTSTTSKIRWQASKRLLYGSLVCLSQDDFETIIFATVTNRNVKDLEKGVIQVRFESDLDVVLNAKPSDTFLMAETTAYFEAYKHVLFRLQNITDTMPFQKYIVDCQSNVGPPKYFLQTGRVTSYDLSTLGTGKTLKAPVAILNTQRWPSLSNFNLDSTQLDAVKTALTKEVAIIQGPPGTGKTYVGLKIAEVLFKNRDAWATDSTSNAVLVVCYTNHALDQFLEGMAKFLDEGIVRVGGRSSSETLAEFNLKELRMKRRKERKVRKAVRDNSMDCKRLMTVLKLHIEEVGGRIESGSMGILHERVLQPFMDDAHYRSLTRGVQSKAKSTAMKQWLGFDNLNTKSEGQLSLENEISKYVKIILITGVPLKYQKYVKDEKVLSMKLVSRVELYRTWVDQFRSHITKKINELEEIQFSGFPDVNELSGLQFNLDSSYHDIMMDTLIRPFVQENVFRMITSAKECSRGEDGFAIKAWLQASNETWNEESLAALQYLRREAAEEGIDDDEDCEDSIEADEEADIIASQRFVDDHDDIFQTKSGKSTFFTMKAMEDVTLSMQSMETGDDSKRDGSAGGWEIQPHQKKNMKKRLESILMSSNTMTEIQVKVINRDVWKIEMDQRPPLYRFWLQGYQSSLRLSILEKEQEYHNTSKRLKEVLTEEDKDILEDALVIGMTTTGAAKHAMLLQAVAPKIIIVEEAAEVLESHIITTLNPKCQHLILIGDHQQLRPNPTVYDLAKTYNLDLSLFERLINNEMHHVTLGLQHRMRPEISLLMKHIYPDLNDHDTVNTFPNALGVEKNIFFVHHEYREEHQNESKSKTNEHEADFITALCRYFLLQGYKPSEVTILAAYTGQILLIKRLMAKQVTLFKGVRLTSIDNFQGEESKIILLSLVRSNEQGSVGFLSIDNRVCVALSRAKEGLYAVGNFKLLADKSDLWKRIVETLKEKQCVGLSLRLVCQNHPEMTVNASKAADFEKHAPEGGCTKICDARLECGHVCERVCHNVDQAHTDFKCRKPCQKGFTDCDHACPKKCFEKCSRCRVLVNKTIPMCGHVDQMPCSTEPFIWNCKNTCKDVMPCGHKCRGKCGECRKSGHPDLCKELVENIWPCGHVQQTPCHESTLTTICKRPCSAILDCGHKCMGSCGECYHGRVHVPCRNPCKKKLPCLHQCQQPCGAECTPCSLRCSSSCSHSRCPELCGQVCQPCKEPCFNGCEHSHCTKLCSEYCNNEPCQKLCPKTLPCSHACVSLCGEACICLECNGNYLVGSSHTFEMKAGVIYIKLQPCGHFFDLPFIEEWMKTFSAKYASQPYCPNDKCKKTVTQSTRYMNIIKKNALELQDMKQKLIGGSVIAMRKAALLRTLIVQSSLPMATIRTLVDVLDTAPNMGSVKSVEEQFQMLKDLDKIRPVFNSVHLKYSQIRKDSESLQKHLLQPKQCMSAQMLREYKSEIQLMLGQIKTQLASLSTAV